MTADSSAGLPAPGRERRHSMPQLGVPAPQALWDPDGPTDPSIAPALWEQLREAVIQVDREWEAAAEHAASAEEVSGYVALLAAAIRQAVVGEAIAELPRTALARRLLGLIRSAVIQRMECVRPGPDSAQMLRIFQAIETVGQALEPDWAQHFADRLGAPDGLELVVEVAHDLRSPLTSILFLAETLQRGRSGPLTPVQERQLGLVYSAAFGLSSMASDVIELARGGDRLVDLDPIPFSVTDILESVRDIVQPIAEEKGLEVRLTPPQSDFRIGHPVALSRVLLNLTTNALKFTDEGHVEVTGVELGGEQIEFAVRDTGRGIPPQAMATLFEPFRRRRRPGEYTFSGSGLGLSICRKLVEAMGAGLEVETVLNEGTRFYFVLALPIASQG